MVKLTNNVRRKALGARPLVAGILALAVLLQLLAAAGPSLKRFASGDESRVVAAFATSCTPDAHGEGKFPARNRCHWQCCVLCGARDFDGAAPVDASQALNAIFARLAATISSDAWFTDGPNQTPIGWASSWSSRAPPHFS